MPGRQLVYPLENRPRRQRRPEREDVVETERIDLARDLRMREQRFDLGCEKQLIAARRIKQRANNGGPTLTLLLLPGSPAIDTGNNDLIPDITTDQRGLKRIVKGGTSLTVDIGAFELQAGEEFVVPTFSTLTVAFDTAAATTTLTGHIGAGTSYPTGSTVSITLKRAWARPAAGSMCTPRSSGPR